MVSKASVAFVFFFAFIVALICVSPIHNAGATHVLAYADRLHITLCVIRGVQAPMRVHTPITTPWELYSQLGVSSNF